MRISREVAKVAKYCSRCRKPRARSEFHKSRCRADGLHIWCKKCVRDYQRLTAEKFRVRKNAAARNWRKNNPVAFKRSVAKWRDAHPVEMRASWKKRAARARLFLTRGYVIKTLNRNSGIPASRIPEALISLQTANLKLKRRLWENRKTQTNSETNS